MEALEAIIERHPSAAWQDIEDQVLVVTPKTKKVHIIDGCGAFIWSYLDQPRTVGSVVEKICLEYDIREEQAKQDVCIFLSELEKKDAVRSKNGG